MKLGDVREWGPGRQAILTSIYPAGVYGSVPLAVWTSIPEGMTAQDLGRRFWAAGLEIWPNHLVQHLSAWPSGSGSGNSAVAQAVDR